MIMNREIIEKNKDFSSEKSSDGGIYYAKLADKYRIVKFSLFALAIIFIALSILFGVGNIKGVQFCYLVKYLDINIINYQPRDQGARGGSG